MLSEVGNLTTEVILNAVHILGCHLQADGWEHMVWGSDGQLGRVPRAIKFAWNAKVSHISWGTGASNKDGKKESRYTFELACTRFLELAKLCGADDHPDPYENAFLKWLAQKSVIDEVTQNTTEELRAAADLCLARGVNQLTLVTSPFHMPRAAKEADIVIRGDAKYKSLLGNILLLPSETSLQGFAPNDEVTIFERPHRGDTPKPPEELMPHKIARRTFKLYKDQAKLEAYLREWGDLFTKYGV